MSCDMMYSRVVRQGRRILSVEVSLWYDVEPDEARTKKGGFTSHRDEVGPFYAWAAATLQIYTF
jgi:hypothetical protein